MNLLCKALLINKALFLLVMYFKRLSKLKTTQNKIRKTYYFPIKAETLTKTSF